ncbi:Nucleoside-diphosphate-sugar epimerase [Saccharopolyspora antimicrobica]|uniref:Nucleoside-diphosphate-sugar epimerase n=1 Tax=Saccharopolyspora antimicrobica TaxID=455193 RepID=A0A1I5KXV0_9PSEU|nr:SDR family oxidoreductase [Saccharopolyspora antimicrobica]RKT89100.1 nucleoside-diphosphate-sugar epimerase [Saccharopolyspora antimicrobica]SFO89466.1 Nucleoside-diphosphate-sugar epimerase [Saccharopolyspora antimicrobica]
MNPPASAQRVVVVGGTGNIGTSVIEALDHDPAVGTIVSLSRREPSGAGEKIRWERADITTDDLAAPFAEADVVIHLAWIFQPTHDPITTWRNNVLGSIRVFEAAATAGVRHLVYASSIAAYSPGPHERPVDENWPTHGWPGSAYSREKAYLERYLDAFQLQHPEMQVTRMRTAFCFKPESASQQRRLFMGPLVINRLVRPDLLPALPTPSGMRFQAVHSDDVGEAYRLAALSSSSGAFNIAAEPLIDTRVLGELLGTHTMTLPSQVARGALSTAWKLHLVPASPDLFDAFLRLPIMDTSRARDELGWTPSRSSTEAVADFLRGLQKAEGGSTPPLQRRARGGRLREFATGVGQRQ